MDVPRRGDVLLANSLLRSLPGVDPDRIGLTGISWGGVVSSLVAGVDDRFVFAAPVYGCGYLYDSLGHFRRMGAEEGDDASLALRKFWDPARYFTDAPIPMLWVNGDNDPHFSADILTRSHVSAGPESTLTIRPRMPHGHGPGWEEKYVPEIYALADLLRNGPPRPHHRTARAPGRQPGRPALRKRRAHRRRATLYALTAPYEYAKPEGQNCFDLATHFEPHPPKSTPQTKPSPPPSRRLHLVLHQLHRQPRLHRLLKSDAGQGIARGLHPAANKPGTASGPRGTASSWQTSPHPQQPPQTSRWLYPQKEDRIRPEGTASGWQTTGDYIRPETSHLRSNHPRTSRWLYPQKRTASGWQTNPPPPASTPKPAGGCSEIQREPRVPRSSSAAPPGEQRACRDSRRAQSVRRRNSSSQGDAKHHERLYPQKRTAHSPPARNFAR